MISVKTFLAVIAFFAFLLFQMDAQFYQDSDHSKKQIKTDTSLVKDVRHKIIKVKYTCPMHPEVISDRPGKCTKCGMTLVKEKPSPVIKKSHKTQKDTLKHLDNIFQ
jgi:hypothetical protein